MTEYELTPVEEHGGILFKREDLYAPYGTGDVNGGKLRQCRALVEAVAPTGVVSACSVHSPQSAICAAVAEEFGLPCEILFGGTSYERLMEHPMPRLAASHGAKLTVAAQTGRHNVLYAKAREIASRRGWFVVEYGFNATRYPDVMFGAIAAQVENVPNVDTLCLTCGSGITSCGVLMGLKRFGKSVGEVHLFATAPDRREMIRSNVGALPFKLTVHDMFHERGFVYEKREPLTFQGMRLHPNYEAKSFRRMVKDRANKGETLFWVVGAEPRFPPPRALPGLARR